MTRVWSYPTRILFGVGSSSALADELRRLSIERVLVATDAGVVKAGVVGALEEQLTSAGIGVARFDGVQGNPTGSNIEAGARAYAEAEAQAVVAVGGGSPLDAAKLIALRQVSQESFLKLDDAIGGDALIPPTVPPVIAIPTTAGTGSEVGRSGVVTDETEQRKVVVFSPYLLPRVAILDPELTRSMPPGVTAATGFDALTHCIEAYLSTGDHPMADAIALGGIELVAGALERAVANGSDLGARGDMMKAAMMGAVAFQKGLGACHSMAHPLSAEYGLHHGLANAVCLPPVVELNRRAVPERAAAIAQRLGTTGERLGVALSELRSRLGLPASLQAAGVNAPDLERLSKLALADGCHATNPVVCGETEFRALFAQVAAS